MDFLSAKLRLELLINGAKLVSIDLRGFADLVEEGPRLVLNVKALAREEGGMVGFGGLFARPSFVGGTDSKEVLRAFDWLTAAEPQFKRLATYASFRSLASGALLGAWELSWPFLFLEVPTLLHRLREARGFHSKLSELRRKLGRPYRLDDPSAAQRFERQVRSLACFSSELSVASSLSGSFDVELGGEEGPDLYVDGVGVEVSTITIPYSVSLAKAYKRLMRKAERESRQGDIIALDVSATPLGPSMWGFGSPRPHKLSEVAREAVGLAERGSKPIILYTYGQNTIKPMGFLWRCV